MRPVVLTALVLVITASLAAPIRPASSSQEMLRTWAEECPDVVFTETIFARATQGVLAQVSDLTSKTFELLREVAPAMRRAALVWDPSNLASARGYKDAESHARSAGLHLISVPVPRRADLEPALNALTRERPDALIVHPLGSIWNDRAMVAEYALKHRLPSITGLRAIADAGLLMSYGPTLDLRRVAADYIIRIVRGATPDDLPVPQPTRIELFVNLKVAETLDLTMLPALLLRADAVSDPGDRTCRRAGFNS